MHSHAQSSFGIACDGAADTVLLHPHDGLPVRRQRWPHCPLARGESVWFQQGTHRTTITSLEWLLGIRRRRESKFRRAAAEHRRRVCRRSSGEAERMGFQHATLRRYVGSDRTRRTVRAHPVVLDAGHPDTSCSGIYDYDYVDYTVRVLRKCKEYGFKIYMDPHQDIVRTLPFCMLRLPSLTSSSAYSGHDSLEAQVPPTGPSQPAESTPRTSRPHKRQSSTASTQILLRQNPRRFPP